MKQVRCSDRYIFPSVLLYNLSRTAVHQLWKNYDEHFNVTSQVTNQTGCMEEKKTPLPSLCGLDEQLSPFSCICYSLRGNHITITLITAPKLSTLLFKDRLYMQPSSFLYLMNLSGVTFLPMSQLEVQISRKTREINVMKQLKYISIFT